MADLDEVLGGVLRALTQARVAADLASKEAYESYRDDAVMAGLAVPRIVVRDVNLTLRFVVNDEQRGDFDKQLEAAASKEWSKIVSRELLALLTSSAEVKENASLREALIRSGREVDASGRVNFHLREALTEAQAAKTVRATLEYLDEITQALPPELKGSVLRGNRLKAHAEARVERLLEMASYRLKEIATARAALGHKFDVSITGNALANAAPPSIHELKITLSTDDLRVVAPDELES
jgi:hypothetical protein